MKKPIQITFVLIIAICMFACGTQTKKEEAATTPSEEVIDQSEKPTVAELHAYKAFHHTRYMVQTAAAAGGTNKLLHTKKLPTEGTTISWAFCYNLLLAFAPSPVYRKVCRES